MDILKLGILVSMMDRFSGPSDKINRQIDKMSNNFSQKARKMSEGISGWADGFNKFEKELEEKRGSIDKFYMKMGAAGYGMERFGAKTLNALGKPIAAFSDLEDGYKSLENAMMRADGSVDPMFDKISKKATDLSNKLPTSAMEMNKVAALALEEGMSGDILYRGGLEASSKFAMEVLNRDFRRAIQMGNELQRAWSLDPEKLNQTFDLMARAKQAGADPEMMQTMLLRTGGQAQAMNLAGFDNLAQKIPILTMLAQLSGLRGESIATNMNLLESRVMDPKKLRAAQKLGMDFQFTDADGNYLGVDNLVKQLEKLKGLSDQKRAAVIRAMFGDSAEISTIVNTLSNFGMNQVQKIQNKMASTASLDQKMANRLDAFSARMDAARGTFETSLGKMGIIFEGPLKDSADIMNSIAGGLGNIAEESPGTARVLGWVAAGLGGTAYLGGKTMMMLAGLGMAWPYATKGFALVKSGLFSMGEQATLFGKLSGLQTGIMIAGAIAWSYVISQLADETTAVGNDLRVAFSNWDGFYAVMDKIAGFLKYVGSYINPFSDDKDREAYLRQGYNAESKIDDMAKKNSIGRYSPEALERAASKSELANMQKEMKELSKKTQTGMMGGQFSFNPSIKIEAGANVNEAQIRKILDEEQKKFFAKMEARQKRNKQLAYGGQ